MGAPSIRRLFGEWVGYHEPLGAPGPGSPRTGLRPWGGDLDFETWDTTKATVQRIQEAAFSAALTYLSSPRRLLPSVEFMHRIDHRDKVFDRCLRLHVVDGIEDESASRRKDLASAQHLFPDLFRCSKWKRVLGVHSAAPESQLAPEAALQLGDQRRGIDTGRGEGEEPDGGNDRKQRRAGKGDQYTPIKTKTKTPRRPLSGRPSSKIRHLIKRQKNNEQLDPGAEAHCPKDKRLKKKTAAIMRQSYKVRGCP